MPNILDLVEQVPLLKGLKGLLVLCFALFLLVDLCVVNLLDYLVIKPVLIFADSNLEVQSIADQLASSNDLVVARHGKDCLIREKASLKAKDTVQFNTDHNDVYLHNIGKLFAKSAEDSSNNLAN